MNIDITSFFFNSEITGATATAAWGTSIGQAESKQCRIETDTFGVTDFLSGMIYKSNTNRDGFDLSKGSSSRDYILYSIFNKVYANGSLIDGVSFIVLLSRENTTSHKGRLILSYPPYAKYSDDHVTINNSETIDAIRQSLGCEKEGCWFAYDLSVKNQDELHFSCVVVNRVNKMVYNGKSSTRSQEWANLIPSTEQKATIPKGLDKTNKQIIYFGAPGTGKSHAIKNIVDKDNCVRTTFHPDSDYSTFVGAYKPTMEKTGVIRNGKEETKITYTFVPQAFLKAYIAAWTNPAVPYYLIIEEINRGNCAQIFGDLFQLLDRKDGESEYPIKADQDLCTYLTEHLPKGCEGISNDELKLPSNLYIYATMNTSDQSLFPIDSAFKRRWDWKYIPINDGKEGWKISADTYKYDWWNFLLKINTIIGTITESEDKKLGYFFAKAEDKTISAEKFVSKVIFYLYNEVFKDNDIDGDLLVDKDNNEALTFEKFFNEDGSTNESKVVMFLDNLKVKKDSDDEDSEEIILNNKREFSIEFADGEKASGITNFDKYLDVLKRIGLDKVEPIAAKKKYTRHGCPLISKIQYDEIINDPAFGYVQVGNYYVVTNIGDTTKVNMLDHISDELQLNLKIIYK